MLVKFMEVDQANNSSEKPLNYGPEGPPGGNKAKHWHIRLNVTEAQTVDFYSRKFEDIKQFLTYYIHGEEIAPSGLHHLQCYVVGINQITRPTLRKWFGDQGSFFVAQGNPIQNFSYCSKDGKYKTFGDLPAAKNQNGGEATKNKWAEIAKLARERSLPIIEKHYPREFVTSYKTLKQISYDYGAQPQNLDDVCGEWLYGESGAGKSHTARTENPNAFIKPMNKWWDGYADQEVVIIEDMDPDYGPSMSYFFKIWADKWVFPAEIKNFQRVIRPKKFVVTSQYKPEEIFRGKTLEAINRRFKLREIVRIKDKDPDISRKTKRPQREKKHDKLAISSKRPRLYRQDADGRILPNTTPIVQSEITKFIPPTPIEISDEQSSSSEDDEDLSGAESDILSDSEDYDDDSSGSWPEM